MIRAVIIDDEKPSRDRVKFFLDDYSEIMIVGEAENGKEGIALLKGEKPQLVFLDIQMPITDGFHVLEKCSHHPAVVFISAYDEYAIRAFDVNAVDYLLKPYTKKRFEEAMERVLQVVEDEVFWNRRISALLASYHSKEEYLDRITVKRGHVYQLYETADIDFFRIEKGFIFLYSDGEKVILDTPLTQLEKKLDPVHFLRVHRNAFINLKKIQNVIPWGNGKLVLDFGASGRVQVSRDKVKLLKQKIGLRI